MRRLTDPKECRTVTDSYPEHFTFDVKEWFSHEENYALIEKDNVGFAEYKSDGIYWVHFCFNSARGREAIKLTQRMLHQLSEEREVKACIGLIEVNNKKARWLIRQVGMQSMGLIETKIGICEMFYKGNKDGV